MKSLALKILGWRTKQNLKKKTSILRKNIGYKEANKVGILFSVTDLNKHEAIKHFIQLLERDDKEVIVLCYLGEGKENFEFRFDYFSMEDLSLPGVIKSEHVLKFANTKFDFLYHIDPNVTNPLIEHILSQCKALCRIGVYQEGKESLYELMLKPAPGKSLENILEEVYHYTKAL